MLSIHTENIAKIYFATSFKSYFGAKFTLVIDKLILEKFDFIFFLNLLYTLSFYDCSDCLMVYKPLVSHSINLGKQI